MAEPSDNIGGGAPGDSTGVLRAIFEYKIPNAAVCLNDPESVSALSGHQPGDKIELQLGGKGSRYDAGPIALTVELISQSDGIFELELLTFVETVAEPFVFFAIVVGRFGCRAEPAFVDPATVGAHRVVVLGPEFQSSPRHQKGTGDPGRGQAKDSVPRFEGRLHEIRIAVDGALDWH